VRCGAHPRKALERLCRYITRPAIAHERLKEDGAGNVLLLRLAGLVPRPRLHLTRFHGVLAPNARLRAALVPGPAPEARLRPGPRTLCPQCGGDLRIIAAIEQPALIAKILTHLGGCLLMEVLSIAVPQQQRQQLSLD